LERTKLLPAYVEITLASGDLASASDASRELEERAGLFPTVALQALSGQALGAVALAADELHRALPALRSALKLWLQVEAPYLAARTRELIGLACQVAGDEEGADLALSAARESFEELGAAPDLARMNRAGSSWSSTTSKNARLTPREVEVLRLVADGKPNKAIAAELAVSAKTVDRHLSNIFTKLGVSSRTAAAAWAYRNKLV
jgi:DNA-binding CsgD family transcriptional regulator